MSDGKFLSGACLILVPIVRQFQDRHDLDGVEMATAAGGMLSAANLTALDEAA